MTDKEVRRLNHRELLEILVEQEKENEQLREELDQLNGVLESRNVRLEKTGSLAEASLSLSGVFEAADTAAKLYLENIENMQAETQAERERILSAARSEADAVRQQAQQELEEVRQKGEAARAEREKLLAEAQAKSEQMLADAEAKSGKLLSEAETQSEQMLADAWLQSEKLRTEAEALRNEKMKELHDYSTRLAVLLKDYSPELAEEAAEETEPAEPVRTAPRGRASGKKRR